MAGDSYPGRNMFLGIGIQNGFADSAGSGATVYTYYQPDDVSGVLEEYTMIPSNRRLKTRFHGAPYGGVKTVPFGFTVECNPMNAGRLLQCILGAENKTTIVTGSAATHKFYTAEDLPYFTLYVYSAGIAENSTSDRTHKIINCKINRAVIEGGIDDVMRIIADGVGTSRSSVTSPTATFVTAGAFFLNAADGTGVLSIGATIGTVAAFNQVRRARYEINNAVSADHRIHGSATPVAVIEGDSEISGNFDAIYNELTWPEITEFQDNDDRAFRLLVTSTALFHTSLAYTLQIDIEQARYTGSPASFDPDIISVQLPWIVELASAAAFSITLRNSTDNAYTYSV